MAQPKLDRRVRRTRTAIHHALTSLMREKGYDAVTVTDIIDRADVGRSTFYTHFTDKSDVLDESLNGLGEFLRAQRDTGGGQLFGFSLAMFEHAQEQRALLQGLLGRRGASVVHDRITRLLAELVGEELVTLNAGRQPAVPVELIVTGVVGAYLALLARWLDETDTHTPQEMDAAFRRLVLPGITAAIGGARR
jgi:AcrR family transcriptional regulator